MLAKTKLRRIGCYIRRRSVIASGRIQFGLASVFAIWLTLQPAATMAWGPYRKASGIEFPTSSAILNSARGGDGSLANPSTVRLADERSFMQIKDLGAVDAGGASWNDVASDGFGKEAVLSNNHRYLVRMVVRNDAGVDDDTHTIKGLRASINVPTAGMSKSQIMGVFHASNCGEGINSGGNLCAVWDDVSLKSGNSNVAYDLTYVSGSARYFSSKNGDHWSVNDSKWGVVNDIQNADLMELYQIITIPSAVIKALNQKYNGNRLGLDNDFKACNYPENRDGFNFDECVNSVINANPDNFKFVPPIVSGKVISSRQLAMRDLIDQEAEKLQLPADVFTMQLNSGIMSESGASLSWFNLDDEVLPAGKSGVLTFIVEAKERRGNDLSNPTREKTFGSELELSKTSRVGENGSWSYITSAKPGETIQNRILIKNVDKKIVNGSSAKKDVLFKSTAPANPLSIINTGRKPNGGNIAVNSMYPRLSLPQDATLATQVGAEIKTDKPADDRWPMTGWATEKNMSYTGDDGRDVVNGIVTYNTKLPDENGLVCGENALDETFMVSYTDPSKPDTVRIMSEKSIPDILGDKAVEVFKKAAKVFIDKKAEEARIAAEKANNDHYNSLDTWGKIKWNLNKAKNWVGNKLDQLKDFVVDQVMHVAALFVKVAPLIDAASLAASAAGVPNVAPIVTTPLANALSGYVDAYFAAQSAQGDDKKAKEEEADKRLEELANENIKIMREARIVLPDLDYDTIRDEVAKKDPELKYELSEWKVGKIRDDDSAETTSVYVLTQMGANPRQNIYRKHALITSRVLINRDCNINMGEVKQGMDNSYRSYSGGGIENTNAGNDSSNPVSSPYTVDPTKGEIGELRRVYERAVDVTGGGSSSSNNAESGSESSGSTSNGSNNSDNSNTSENGSDSSNSTAGDPFATGGNSSGGSSGGTSGSSSSSTSNGGNNTSNTGGSNSSTNSSSTSTGSTRTTRSVNDIETGSGSGATTSSSNSSNSSGTNGVDFATGLLVGSLANSANNKSSDDGKTAGGLSLSNVTFGNTTSPANPSIPSKSTPIVQNPRTTKNTNKASAATSPGSPAAGFGGVLYTGVFSLLLAAAGIWILGTGKRRYS